MNLRKLWCLSAPLIVLACTTKEPGDSADESTSDPLTTTMAATMTTGGTTADEPTGPGSTGEASTSTGPEATAEATTDPTAEATAEATTDPTAGSDPQTPPQGFEAVEAWLAEGHYKNWACEAAPHDPLPISPHGINRICSNDLLSGHLDPGEYPVGSAGVKELYDQAGANIIGYAVYLHTTAGMTGDTWYWYERVPLDSMAPHDQNGVVADGLGDSGPAMTICVGCHSATGIDADHPGHDFVYTQVQ